MAIRTEFRVKKTLPPPEKVIEHLMKEAEKILYTAGVQSVKDRQKTTKTWKGSHPYDVEDTTQIPDFYFTLSNPERYVTKLEVAVTGPEYGIKKWFWISEGTKVRYAVMTKDFKPKTKVGVISSYVGRGRRKYVNPAVMRPGIDKRGFDDILNQRQEERIQKKWETALKKGMKRKRF